MGHPGVSGFGVLALLFSLVQPVQAQSSPQLDLTPFAGGALFVNDLASDMLVCDGGCERIQTPKMDNGIAFGAHAGLRFGAWSLEGTAAMVPTSWSGEETGGGQRSVDTSVLILGGNVLYTIPTENQLMEVFLAAGGGIKSHSPDEGDSATNPMGNVGLGLRVFISPSMALRFEGRDYISPYEDGNVQNDLLVTVGLSFSPGGGS